METHSKNTGFGGLSRRRCLAIWNSAAWRASKGGKSENSIAWEAVTAGKSENSLAWEAPTGGKSENSLAWGAPTGGKSENSLAWGAPTGGKSENSLAWGAPTGGKSENSLAWGAPTGGKSENSLAWGAPTGGGEVKLLSLGSPHGGKPPLAPLTDRNKPAVWAATPREAGWIECENLCQIGSQNSYQVEDEIKSQRECHITSQNILCEECLIKCNMKCQQACQRKCQRKLPINCQNARHIDGWKLYKKCQHEKNECQRKWPTNVTYNTKSHASRVSGKILK